MRKLKTINVGYMDVGPRYGNCVAHDAIEKETADGWGIDSIAYHPSTKETFITFYKYQVATEDKSWWRRIVGWMGLKQ